MVVASAWYIWYTLNSGTYHPLQSGIMSSTLRNDTKQKMIVTEVGLTFDWMKDTHWYQDCILEIEPGAQVELPYVSFQVSLDASNGAHECKPGVVYKLLTEKGWEPKDARIGYIQSGVHVMITEAPDRDFEVFISHSNSQQDAPLLDRVTDSFYRCGINTYVAERKPQPGYPLWQKIEAAIRRADAILILWTKAGSEASDIREEIGIAIGAQRIKRIIPLVETGLTTQGSLIGLEHIPLDMDKPLEALSTAVSRVIEWADKKEQGKPKVAPSP